jgi:hypothetical protein
MPKKKQNTRQKQGFVENDLLFSKTTVREEAIFNRGRI